MASSSVDPQSVTHSARPSYALSFTSAPRLTLEADTLLHTLSGSQFAQCIDPDRQQARTSDTWSSRRSFLEKNIPLPLQNISLPLKSISVPLELPSAKASHSRHSVDGGYGWFVTLGSFMSHMVEGCFERGEGIFFLHFIRRFGTSNQMTTLPSAMASTLRFLLSPLASTVCNCYSIRTSVMFGAIIFTTGVFLTQFVHNFYLLFLTYALLTGCGRAFFSGPALIIIGLYFRRRQGVASGLAASGVGFGTFFLVPLIQYLFDHYGFEGAFLILSGVAAHMHFVAMLYRPLSTNDRYAELAKKEALKKSQSGLQKSATMLDRAEVSHAVDICEKQPSATATPEVTDKPSDTVIAVRKSLSTLIIGKERAISEMTDHTAMSSNLTHAECGGVAPIPDRCRRWKRWLCNTCCCKICFPVETFNRNPEIQPDRRIFHCYLLSHRAFFYYCSAVVLFTAGFKAAYVFLPPLMISKGHSINEAAFVVSVSGPIDTVTRISIGVAMDLDWVRPYRMRLFNCFLVGLAFCSVILPWMRSLSQFAIALTVYSVVAGMCFATRTVVLVDLLGVHRLANAFGLLMFFQGVGTLVGPPLAGFLYDELGSPYFGYYMAGTCMTLAALCMNISIYWHTHSTE